MTACLNCDFANVDSEFINYILTSAHKVNRSKQLRKTTKATALIAVFIIVVFAASVFTSGVLQNGSSKNSDQNNGLARYTGYLVEGHSCLVCSNSSYPDASSEEVTMTFADGRTFIADLALVMSRNIAINSTCTVCYNVSEPTLAVDIIS